MRVFISWSEVRSQVLGLALKDWLPQVVDGIEAFHSADIAKGKSWRSDLIDELRRCSVGVFRVTPESLRSQWMLFEAGALAQHGDSPRLFTYLYGINELPGPLGHFQATHFVREDSRRFVLDLANATHSSPDAVAAEFDKTWDAFEKRVLEGMVLPIQKLIPEFPRLFENHKTFHESFPDCSDRRWEERLKRTAWTHERLLRPEVEEIVSRDRYLGRAHKELLYALDRYGMHIAANLMQLLDYKKLDGSEQRQLEDARKDVLDLVSSLQQKRRPPVVWESLDFESEPSTKKRKALIHDWEARLRNGELSEERLLAARDSLDWALDRIIYYAARGRGLLPKVSLAELVLALEREEEMARTRDLTRNLQPLYYAAECIDQCIAPPIDTANALRLLEIMDRVEDFVKGHRDRDSGGHIRRRITSIRNKLK
jgi:hypothetical protein